MFLYKINSFFLNCLIARKCLIELNFVLLALFCMPIRVHFINTIIRIPFKTYCGSVSVCYLLKYIYVAFLSHRKIHIKVHNGNDKKIIINSPTVVLKPQEGHVFPGMLTLSVGKKWFLTQIHNGWAIFLCCPL